MLHSLRLGMNFLLSWFFFNNENTRRGCGMTKIRCEIRTFLPGFYNLFTGGGERSDVRLKGATSPNYS